MRSCGEVGGVEAEEAGIGWEEVEDLGERFGEAVECGGLVGGVEEAGGEVALVVGVAAGEVFGGLVELVELVLGDAGVEPG